TIRAETPDGASLVEKLYVSTPFYTHDTDYSLRRLTDADIAVGSDVSFALYRGMDPVTSGTLLVSAWHDSLLSASVNESGSYTLTFTEEYLPNVLLSGAYFDGAHIHPVSLSYVSYSSRERELNISIETDAASYAPGAEALVTLRITDADGNPVSTPFALGVVDNAAFAVMEQYIDPLSGVYAERYFEGPVQYHSYVDHTNGLSFAAEGGGEGGGGSVRDDFKDTAAFLTGVTGADGTAAVRFPLPDNLTSWRLTAVAVADISGHPYAGKGVANVSTGLPFFLNVVYNEEILTGDNFSLSLRTVGGGAPQYTVTLSGGSVDITRELAGSANGFTYVNLGTLPAGVYTLTVRARSGELADAVSYPVSVVESRQEIAVSSCFALSDGVQLDSLRYPVRLTFCDAVDADALRALSRASVAGPSRLDGALASVTADRLLRDTDSTAVLDSFRDYTGAFRLFSYGDATAEATAWMLLISPESVGTEAARRFLYNVLYTRDSASYEVAYAYMGLAALGEPILADVRLLLRSGNNLTLTDELSLAVSLALLGDTEEARTWYEQNRSRIGDPADSDEAFSASLLSMVLCRLCGMDAESHALFEAILDTPNDRVSPAFALLAYLTRLPAADASASFAYVLGGKRHTVSFADVRFFTLTLSESELAAADFRLLSGEVEVCASFVSSLEGAERSADGYSVTQVFSGDLTPGGRAVLTVQVQLPDGTESAELSLALPAGMRYVGMPDSFDHTWWVANEENGRVRVFLYADETSRFTVTLNLRCVLPGTYRAEPAVVTDNRAASAGGSIAAVGGGTRVTIQ
ncbi:MAG: alpha-2-macroglobulin family protein, partial [Clostridiaceae bacterium]|nr:alpha-2-macroglobulin family protein [Clostridiaceae bacterium]